MSKVTNKRLEQILDKASEQVKILLRERAHDIQKAFNETIEEAHANDKESMPPMKIALGVSVDLEKDSVESVIRFNCVYTSKLSSDLPDPNQLDLIK